METRLGSIEVGESFLLHDKVYRRVSLPEHFQGKDDKGSVWFSGEARLPVLHIKTHGVYFMKRDTIVTWGAKDKKVVKNRDTMFVRGRLYYDKHKRRVVRLVQATNNSLFVRYHLASYWMLSSNARLATTQEVEKYLHETS